MMIVVLAAFVCGVVAIAAMNSSPTEAEKPGQTQTESGMVKICPRSGLPCTGSGLCDDEEHEHAEIGNECGSGCGNGCSETTGN